MEAAHVAVVSVDLILAVPILLSLVVLVCQRLALHRHPSTAPPHVANRPLAFLLSLHVLLFCLWLPSLLAVLLPNSFPCPLLLIPLYCFSHLVLSLLTIAGVRLHLHSSINARIFARLLPSTSPSSSLSPSPSPSASLTLPGHSPHSSLTSSGHPFLTRSTYTDNAQEFCITITSVDDSAPSTPSSHAEAAVGGDLDGDRVKNHRYQAWGQWVAPAFVSVSVLVITSISISLLDSSRLSSSCGAQPVLLTVLVVSTAPYVAAWVALAVGLAQAPMDAYGRKRELALLACVAFPLYGAALLLLEAAWSPYAFLLLHLALAAVSLITTALPLCWGWQWGIRPARPSSVQSTPRKPAAAELQMALLSPSASLLSYLRCALVMPELSLLLSVHAYHRLFLPSASFHLPLRNLHLERIKQQRKGRKSPTSPSALPSPVPPSPTSSSRQLQKLLFHATSLYQCYLSTDSYQYVRLPDDLHAAVRGALTRLSLDAAAVAEEAAVAADVSGGSRVSRRMLEKKDKKDALQCMLELGELYIDLEKHLRETLAGQWVARWVDGGGKLTAPGEQARGGWMDGAAGSTSPSLSSSSRSASASPRESPVLGSAAVSAGVEASAFMLAPRATTPTPPSVTRGSFAHLHAMHEAQQRRQSRNAVAAFDPVGHPREGVRKGLPGVGASRHSKSRSVSALGGDGQPRVLVLQTRRSSLQEGSVRRGREPRRPPQPINPHGELLIAEITRPI